MSFHALKQINFDLRGPNPEDPEQLLMMVGRISEAVLLINQCTEIPPMHNSLAFESEADIAQKSIPTKGIPDLEWLLQPFRRLRRTWFCTVTISPDNKAESKAECLAYCQDIEMLATSKTAFDDTLRKPISKDYEIREMEIVQMLRAHVTLDYLLGDTAALLRRERYQYWERFEDSFAALPFEDPICFDLPTWAKTRGRWMDRHWLSETTHLRYLDVRTWCPYDYEERVYFLDTPDSDEPIKVTTTMRSNKCRGESIDGQDLWHIDYPVGIPSFDSDDYWRNKNKFPEYYRLGGCWAHYQWDEILDLPECVWDWEDEKDRRLRPHMLIFGPYGGACSMAR